MHGVVVGGVRIVTKSQSSGRLREDEDKRTKWCGVAKRFERGFSVVGDGAKSWTAAKQTEKEARTGEIKSSRASSLFQVF